jgi:hypothetical protein
LAPKLARIIKEKYELSLKCSLTANLGHSGKESLSGKREAPFYTALHFFPAVRAFRSSKLRRIIASTLNIPLQRFKLEPWLDS